MILFVPSTGFQSSATFPIALPGGSRTSRISGSEIIVLRYTGPIGLKHFASELSNAGRTEVLPALRQERFPPGFRHEDVPARRGDFANHREPSTISQGRFRIPLEHRLNRIGTNRRDRKSTRLNSSHGYISYAVFCLKKKKKQQTRTSINIEHNR